MQIHADGITDGTTFKNHVYFTCDQRPPVWNDRPNVRSLQTGFTVLGRSLVLTHWSLVNVNIMNDSEPQQLARQAPAAQDATGACLAGYYGK